MCKFKYIWTFLRKHGHEQLSESSDPFILKWPVFLYRVMMASAIQGKTKIPKTAAA